MGRARMEPRPSYYPSDHSTLYLRRYVNSPNEESTNKESPTPKYPKLQKVRMVKDLLLNLIKFELRS